MTTIKDFSTEQLENEIKRRKLEKKAIWERIGVNCIVCEGFTTYLASNAAEVKKVLESFEPYKDMGEIKATCKNYYTDSPVRYRINCNQEYQGRKLKISFGLLNHDVNVEISYNNLPSDIKEMFYTGERNVSETEYHYFTGVSMEQLRKIKLPTFAPNGNCEVISWYKGDKTVLTANFINEIISKFLNNE